MQSPKIQIKYFAQQAPALEHFVPVFHRWIRDRVLNETVIDVVDYAHVHHGPGVVLVGHASDYYMDQGEGRVGLLYSRKREPAAPEARIIDGFRRALVACRLLEQEPGLGVRFRTDEVLIRIPDRLNAPNSDEGFAALKGELEAVVTSLYGGSARIERAAGDKSALSARVTADGSQAVSDLLGRLEA